MTWTLNRSLQTPGVPAGHASVTRSSTGFGVYQPSAFLERLEAGVKLTDTGENTDTEVSSALFASLASSTCRSTSAA